MPNQSKSMNEVLNKDFARPNGLIPHNERSDQGLTDVEGPRSATPEDLEEPCGRKGKRSKFSLFHERRKGENFH